jgi:hypothetical protein
MNTSHELLSGVLHFLSFHVFTSSDENSESKKNMKIRAACKGM